MGTSKKSPPQYVENLDLLLGSNPLEGVLQFWNNQTKFSLAFLKYTFTKATNTFNVTIPDPNFYFVLAVTCELTNAGFFRDYGSAETSLGTTTIVNGGTGYNFGDTFQINGSAGGSGAIGQVTAEGGGTVIGFDIIDGGSGYIDGDTATTLAITGTGVGLTLDALTTGIPYTDTSEFPMWNIAQQGPDLIDAGYQKYYPFLYKWVPGDGAVVNFPLFTIYGPAIPNSNFVFHIYYAAISSEGHFHVPITRNCLTFEPVLGDGPEYDGPRAPQQILYPEYAGAGSEKFDLGSGAVLPTISCEVKGSFARWHPRGDADFTDMIEDTLKSGMLQVGSQLGLIQRGVNLNELPGAIQKILIFIVSGNATPTNQHFSQPNTVGDVLIAFARWVWEPGISPTISDDAGNTWIPVFVGNNAGMWYAIANSAAVYNGVHCGTTGAAAQLQFGAVELDQGTTEFDNSATATGTTDAAECSIEVTGAPVYIVAFIQTLNGANINPKDALNWSLLFPNSSNGLASTYYRVVSKPGTYSIRFTGASGGWQIGMAAFDQVQPAPYPASLGNILDPDSLAVTRAQCYANGLFGSVTMTQQKPAADWLTDFAKCANAAFVWSGFILKLIARSEVSFVGNGTVFTSPYASGPVADLTEDDLIGDSSGPLITVNRKAQVDANNIVQAQFYDRNSDYNPSTASEPLSGAIALFGPRKESPMDLPMIQDPAVARMILGIYVRRYSLLRNSYKFTADAQWILLEARDLITITDSKIGINKLPVIITKITENDQFELEIEAEPFVWGCNAPNLLPTTISQPYTPSGGGSPGSVNTPIIFEPVPRLINQQNVAQIWAVVSGISPDYGGCQVYLSTDGGSSYNLIGNILGNATTGYTVGDWPAANDPDSVNTLNVDLTESNGELATYAAADRDNFTYPCYVAPGLTCIPYELMTYDVATLTATSKYSLVPTLRRAVFSAPQALAGVDHPNNSRFAFLDPMGIGIFKINMDQSWIGKTLHFKFAAINSLGGATQALSDATDYTYTPTGCPSETQVPNNVGYTITGGALTQPTATTIHMAQATAHFPSNTANYNARTFTIPAPTVATTYYVTIADPQQLGDTGTMTNLTATCQTSNALVGVPGNVYIGSITAVPGGGATSDASQGGGVTAGGVPVSQQAPTNVGFIMNSGATGTNVGPELLSLRPSQITKARIVVKASDPSTDLVFDINRNGTTIFSADITVTHGTAAGTIIDITSSLSVNPLQVTTNDVWTIDISSGTATWQFTVEVGT